MYYLIWLCYFILLLISVALFCLWNSESLHVSHGHWLSLLLLQKNAILPAYVFLEGTLVAVYKQKKTNKQRLY